MDWLKALRWSSLGIHNNLIFVLPLTCITKVTPLLRHMHTSSANAQKDVFFCLFIHPLLPFLQHLSRSLHPIWGITRKYKNTTETFLKKKQQQKNRSKPCFLKYPILPPTPPCACSAPLQQSASTLFEAKKGGRKSGGVQQLRAQGYSTKMNRTELGMVVVVGGGV